jgi:hypothetical protein
MMNNSGENTSTDLTQTAMRNHEELCGESG